MRETISGHRITEWEALGVVVDGTHRAYPDDRHAPSGMGWCARPCDGLRGVQRGQLLHRQVALR
jgi:hypothetical protein